MSFPPELDLKSKLEVQVSRFRFRLSQSSRDNPGGRDNRQDLLLKPVVSWSKQADCDFNRIHRITADSVFSEQKGK